MWTSRRRRRRWLDDWESVAADRLWHWRLLDADERTRLGEVVEWMVRTKHWEAARGFELTQEMVVSIAAYASLLVLGLDLRVYRDVRAIIVHPSTITRHGPRSTTIPGVVAGGPSLVLGHALDRRGPVVIAWDAARRDMRRRRRGHNVVIHEFAHKIDAADGLFDGTPQIFDRSERAEWVRVCTAEYEQLRRDQADPDALADPVLRSYATENPSEFFAVATEAFFERPLDLAEHKPDLYRVLHEYFGQDTAARARRHAPATTDAGDPQ